MVILRVIILVVLIPIEYDHGIDLNDYISYVRSPIPYYYF